LCARYQSKKFKEPLLNHSIPDKPFIKIGVDISEYRGVSYLIINDYSSKWLDIKKLSSKSADLIIKISYFGIPKLCVSDNVPYNRK